MSQAATDSLLWIKNELDHTLARARIALEAYVERPNNDAALGECLELLHQVQGTLRIVEVYGAAMLAEEMEAVVRGLRSGELVRSDAAFEVLVRAMLQLPDYLERVIGGRRDMPMALLSLLNDLRAVRGQALLSESALFAYNLAGRSASIVGHAPAPAAVDIRSLAAKLRPKFQMALLGWYKGKDAARHLGDMADAAEKLEQAATTPAVFELWWIVGGVIEGLRDGGMEADVGLKQLLGQVDRQIKRLMDRGEAPLPEDPAAELVNNLLYYIGRARSHGKRVAAIKESFKLGELLPGERELATTREQMAGPNAGLMRTVSGALKEDIARIKDTLDLYVRMRKSDASELAPLDPVMKKVGDTLGVLQLPELRELLENNRVTLKKIVSGQRPADQDALLEMASGIVSVESRLDAAMLELLAPGAEPARAEGTPALSPELQDVRHAVVRESIIGLARVKEAIAEFVNDPARASNLQPLPDQIREIQGSLGFLEMQRVVVLLDSVRQYIRKRLLAGSGVPPQNELDRMADAIVSIEFYLEAVQQARGNPISMLDNAEACVGTLGFPVGRSYRDEEAPATADTGEVSTLGLETSVVEPEEIVIGPVDAEALETGTADALPAESTPIPVSVVPTVAQSPEVTGSGSPSAVPAPAVVPRTDLDPEILQVFLEEAREELESLREQFPRWRANPADREALVTVRRSFHTLKGSGRMVGAQRIGELAWALENMLNHVIDGVREPSDGMFELVERGIAVLPELVQQLEAGHASSVDVQPIMDAAAVYSRADGPVPGVAPAVTAPTKSAPRKREHPTPPVADLGMVEPEPPADAKLREIFTRETRRHLAVLEAFLESSGAGAHDCRPSEELVRAMHTLQGSASMAGVSALAALADPVQRELMEMSVHGGQLSPAGFAVLGEVLLGVRNMLAAFDAGREPPAAEPGLIERIEMSLRPAVAPAPPVAVPPAKSAPRQAAPTDLEGNDPDLAAIFFDEANELLDSTDEVLQRWSQNRSDAQCVMQLQRNLHTLKGGARMAGLTPIGDLSHELETVLTDIVDGRLAISTEIFALLTRSVDRLHRTLEQGFAGKPMLDAGDLIAELQRLHNGELETGPPGATEDELTDELRVPAVAAPAMAPIAAAAVSSPSGLPETAAEAALGGTAERRSGSRIQHELVRIRADLLEDALNSAGEVGIYRARLEQEVHSMHFNLEELEQTVARLREQLRKLEIETEAQILHQFQQEGGERAHPEFDPLELDRYSLLQQFSRTLAESVADLVSLQDLLLGQARDASGLLVQQSRASSELQDDLMRTRMVPLARHAQRLRRVVRQTAEECRKQVEFKLVGSEVEMDRQVLERVLAPLEHMLRNSVVHGVETPQVRERHGKPAVGNVTVTVRREGSEVVIEVGDDGAGLNLPAIRRKAADMGLIPPDHEPDEAEIMAYILEPGFSTAAQVSQSAGRGVGMDVVASEAKQLGGTLKLDSTAGHGAKFTIRLPFTLSIVQALLVTVAEQPYAIPLPTIEGIARVARGEIERLLASESPEYLYGGRPYRLQHLSFLLGLGVEPLPAELATVPLLLVRTGESDLALIAEGMQGSREVVVKSVGPQVSSIPGISGATILGDGSIMLILDVTGLVRNASHLGDSDPRAHVPRGEDRRVRAMVVDDSITVRRVTQRLLERAGMRVLTAKDGVDALALLQENRPDVMLLDIEMPRMDGYEVLQYLRNDERFRELPVIMVTSRTGEKHRKRAVELGVNRYLGKPFQESELLDNIRALVGSLRRTSGRRE